MYSAMPAVEACARCAVPNASFTKTSASSAYCLDSSVSFFSSPGLKRTFSSKITSPSFISAIAFSTSSPIDESSFFTVFPRSSDNLSPAGVKRISSCTSPLGRPRWLAKITFAPAFVIYSIVGSAALMRVSSVTAPSSIGTLKSTRQNTRWPFNLISLIVFFMFIQ